ncbi:MAG: metal ABC transporter substrate-binding protein, partial [Anaerolineae bacterium]|nr:metal ABC transporter substrate-binding protein [Anaerolineae bacterium]
MQTTPKNPLTPFLLLAMVWLLAACAIPSPDTPPTSRLPDALPLVPAFPLSQGEKLSVVATTGLIADVVANIAAQDIDLTILIGPGQDPHTFEPAPRAVAAIESADIIFINGFGFEQVLLDTIQNVAQGVVVPVSAGIQHLQSSGTEHHDVDP